jgi:hypothetical protein
MKKLLATIAGLAMASAALAQVDTSLPMVTGRGNVSTHPQKVIVTNQTATPAATPAAPAATTSDEGALTLEKFVVTGTLMRSAPKDVQARQK